MRLIGRSGLLLLTLFLALPLRSFAGITPSISPQLDQCVTIEETDGTPSNAICGKLSLPNGSLTDDGDGTYTLSTSLESIYDILAYGAVCDDSTDDTAAIQSAIDAARDVGGGVVWHPAMVCKTTASLQLYDGVRYIGAGESFNGTGGNGTGAVLHITGDEAGFIIDGDTGHGIEIAYLQIKSDRTQTSQDAIYMYNGVGGAVPRNINIHDMSIKDMGRDGIRIDTFSYVTLRNINISTVGRVGVNVVEDGAADTAEYLIMDRVVAGGFGNGLGVNQTGIRISDGSYIYLYNCDVAWNNVGLYISSPPDGTFIFTSIGLSVAHSLQYGIEMLANQNSMSRFSFYDTMIDSQFNDVTDKGIYVHSTGANRIDNLSFQNTWIRKNSGTAPTLSVDIDPVTVNQAFRWIGTRDQTGGAWNVPTNQLTLWMDEQSTTNTNLDLFHDGIDGGMTAGLGDLLLTAEGDDLLLDAGLTVGSTTEAGDNNLRVEGTSALLGSITLQSGDLIENTSAGQVRFLGNEGLILDLDYENNKVSLSATTNTNTIDMLLGMNFQDDKTLGFGSNSEWKVEWDDSAADQLLFYTTQTAAVATTDPMIQMLVGTTPTADQQVFGIAKGTQASNTDLLVLDEDGDLTITGATTTTTLDTGQGANELYDLPLASGADADSATSQSDSGMEIVSTGLTLLRGCDDNEILKWDETADDWNCEADADSGGATAYDAIGNPTGAGSISFDDGETAEYDGANDNETFMTISLNAGDLTGDTEALLITAVDNDDANYIPLLIQDDQDGTPDNLFLVDYQGNAHLGGDPADQGIIRLTNASIIAWEDGTETTLTHVDNTGLLLNTNLTAATINSTGNFQTNANILSPNALTIYTTGGSDDIIIDANSGGAADIALGVSGDVDTINMYGAVTTDGNLTIGSAATLDVNTGTLDNVVTLNLTAGGLSDNSIEANDMVHEDHGEITYAGGSAVVEDSLAVTSWTLTTPLVSGKSDADAGAVNDDSCVGEQGLWWYDDTDSQFEFCNADSGAPVALPTTAGDITSVFDVASGAVTDILVASGESITVAAEGQIESTEMVVSTWNDTGAILYACTAVYISGFNVPNDLPTIAIADSDNAAAMPALGLVEDDIADGAAGHVVVSGHHDAWDTAGLTVGNELYVNTSGTSADNTCSNTLTATRPTGITTEIQKVGSVMRVNPANGEVEVSGAGRSNDVPNLQDDYFWLGNGSNVATAVQMSSEATIDNAGAVTLADSVAVTSWNLTTPTFTTTALLAGILQDNDDMVFEVDANNDGSNKYSFTDGASAEIASLTEAGLLTVIGGVDLGTSQALVGTTAMTIGDNGQTVAVNSSDWDIGATGIATGMGNITSDGTVEGATITEGGNAVPNVTDNLSVFAATSSAQLYGVLNDETGSAAGAPLAVFSVNPTLTGLTAAAATYDFGAGSVVVELPNEAAPTTDATGEIALDTTIVDHQPLWQYYDGGENMTIIAIDTAELPALDNEIVKYNAGTDKFVLEADAGGGSGAFSDAGDPIVQNTTTKDVQIGDGAGTLTGKLEIGGDADQPQLVVEGNGTQTDSLIIAQTDADVEVFTVDVSGLITTDDDVKHADSAGASTWTLENLDQDQDILIRNDDGGSAETSIQVHGDNGIITFAEQSAARAYLSANQLNLVSGTYTKILFDAETFDIQSEFDSTTNNRFDAIEAGMYQINTCVSWTSVVANKQYALVARVNGSNVTAKFSHSGNTTVGVSTCVSDVVELAASDYVEVWGRQLSGVNTVDVNGSEDITFLTVAKIH